MRVARLLLIAMLSCGALLVAAPAAGAASRNCAALNSLTNKLDSLNTTGKNFNLGKFEDVGSEFHDAADKAKGKLKSALNNLGNLYESIGGGDVSDLRKLSGSSYTRSLKTFTTATINCS